MTPSGFPLTSVLLIVHGLPPQELAAASPEAARRAALAAALKFRAAGLVGPIHIHDLSRRPKT